MSRDSNKSSTVLRSFKVLEAVAKSATPPTASQLAQEMGMDRVTCYRTLRTIEEAGYLVHDEASKTYRLGRKILSLAQRVMSQDDERESIEDVLRAVSAATGETCHYSEMDGQETTLTHRAKGRQLVAVDFQIGTRCELHATSVGKAILAHQSPDFIDRYLGGVLKRYTNKTIVDPEALRAELDRIRNEGVSYDMEELSVGMNCVAVPVRRIDGSVVSGISISGPDSRFSIGRLKELAAAIQSEIGDLQIGSF